MTRITFTVDHPGAHYPESSDIDSALSKALHAKRLKRDGDYRVMEMRSTSGVDTELTVEVGTVEPDAKATKKRTPAAKPDDPKDLPAPLGKVEPLPVAKPAAEAKTD